MTDESIALLKGIVASNVSGPAFYKGDFHLNHSGRAAMKVLYREAGINSHVDDDTGRVTFSADEPRTKTG